MASVGDQLYKTLIASLLPVASPYRVSPGDVALTVLFHDRSGYRTSQAIGSLSEIHVKPIHLVTGDRSSIAIFLEMSFYSEAVRVPFLQRYGARWTPALVSPFKGDLLKLVFDESEPLTIEIPSLSPEELKMIEGITSEKTTIFDASAALLRARLFYKGQVTKFTSYLLRRRALFMRRGVDYARSKKYNRKGLPHSRPSLTPVTQNFPTQEHYWIDGVSIINASSNTNLTMYSRSESRVLTPNFFSLKRSLRPVNPYSMSEVRLLMSMGYQSATTIGSSPTFDHFWVAPSTFAYSPPAPDFTPDSSVESKAYSRLVTAAEREGYNLAVDLVQFRQVTDMIAANLTRIAKSYRALRHGDISTATNELFDNRPPRFRKGHQPSLYQSTATNWLELQYGWKPLLNDIHELIQHVHLSYREDLRSARSSASGKTENEIEHLGPFNIAIAGVSPYVVGKTTIFRESHVRYGIKYRHSSQALSFLSQTGFTNPINLAWELIPFSFVVDWAYPLGPYLENLAAFQGLDFAGGFKTVSVRETVSTVISDARTIVGSGATWDIRCQFRSFRTSFRMQRSVLSTFPQQPAIPFKNPITVTHAANALALVKAGFKESARISR